MIPRNFGQYGSLAGAPSPPEGEYATDVRKPTNPGGDKYAQEMNAWLHRQQWEDYKHRFQPIENRLIDENMGTKLLDERLGTISATADKAFESSMLNADVTRGRYGIHEGEQQAQSQLRKMMLGKSQAIADARNNTRTAVYDRNMNTLAGGSSSVNSAIR